MFSFAVTLDEEMTLGLARFCTSLDRPTVVTKDSKNQSAVDQDCKVFALNIWLASISNYLDDTQ